MASVFLSYRRSDTEDVAGRLHADLEKGLGAGQVFKDVDSIHLGDEFPAALATAMERSRVVLVLIGKGWADARSDAGDRRLDQPADFVRREVEAGLAGKKIVIPVLVGGAPMPAAQDLPESLRPLVLRQAARLRPDPDFNVDVARILRRIPGVKPPPIFLRNLLLLLALLGLITFWLLRYSQWFTGVSAIASWGGAFALLGIVFRVLPDQRVAHIKRWIDEKVFINRRATLALTGFIAGALILFSFIGSIRITVPASEAGRGLSIHDPGERPAPEVLEVGDLYRPCWTTPWSPRERIVHVRGLPPKRVRVGWWGLEKLTVPVSFLRPVVLVRCDSLFLAKTAAKPPAGRQVVYRLLIDGEAVTERLFNGKTLCIGCERSLGIPSNIHEKWDGELPDLGLSSDEAQQLTGFWFADPDAPPDLRLRPNQSLQIVVVVQVGDRESTIGRTPVITIEDPQSTLHFPQDTAIEDAS